MAESVDASVSNTDRETCAGSTPARSTEQASSFSTIRLLLFHFSRSFLQTQAEEGASCPLVLIDDNRLVVEQGVVHHKAGSGEIARREIKDNGSTLVEQHIETHVSRFSELAVDGNLIAIINNKSGKCGEVEQPLFAKDKIVAVAATNADMPYTDTHILHVGFPLFQIIA